MSTMDEIEKLISNIRITLESEHKKRRNIKLFGFSKEDTRISLRENMNKMQELIDKLKQEQLELSVKNKRKNHLHLIKSDDNKVVKLFSIDE